MKRTAPLSRRSGMQRGSSKLKRSPLGRASAEQKAKVAREGPRILTMESAAAMESVNPDLDPAHVVPRAIGGCDHEDCIVPLTRAQHRRYDEGQLDLLPYLTLAEQAHAVRHLGLIDALRRTTGQTYVPEEA